MPLLKHSNFDAYFCGHEHVSSCSRTKNNERIKFRDQIRDNNGICFENKELFPYGIENRNITEKQGTYLHQFTVGASGKDPYPIYQSGIYTTEAEFIYSENIYNSFALVTVTTE